MSRWNVIQMARRRPDGEMVPDELALGGAVGGMATKARSKPAVPQPQTPNVTEQVAPFRALMGDRRIADDRSMSGAQPTPQIGPPAPVQPSGLTYEGVRDRQKAASQRFNDLNVTVPGSERSLGQIAEMRALNTARQNASTLLQPVRPALTPEQALADAQNSSNIRARGVGQALSQYEGRALNPAEMMEKERLQGVLGQLRMGPPAPPETFQPDADRRLAESARDFAFRESGVRPDGSRLMVGNLPVEGARAKAEREVNNSRMMENYLMERNRMAGGQGARLQDATAGADIAEQNARAAVATAAGDPQAMANRQKLEEALSQAKIAEAQGGAALSQAKTRQIQQGSAPELVSSQLAAEDAAMAASKVDPSRIAADFERVLPSIRSRIGQGGFVDEFLYGTPRGAVGGGSTSLDTVNQGVDQLLRTIAPLEEAERRQPGTGAATARQLLDLLPAPGEGGEYGVNAMVPGVLSGLIPGAPQIMAPSAPQRMILSQKLNDLRRRLVALSGGKARP